MIRLIHTADWHLGQNFFGNDRTQEHEHFLTWMLAVIREQRPDALLIAGDVFDNANPPASAERLFWDFLDRLTSENPRLRVIITSGNHDSANRLSAPEAIYRRIGVQVRSSLPKNMKGHTDWESLCIPVSSIDNDTEEVVIVAVPFLRSDDYDFVESPAVSMRMFYETLLKNVSKRFPHLPVVLMAHYFAVGSKISQTEGNDYFTVGGQNAVDSSSLTERLTYGALGHIHHAQPVGGKENIWYSGSALPMSFMERDYHHGVNMVEIDGEASVKVSRILYEPLRSMMSIPGTGTASCEEVIRMLGQLPAEDKKDNKDTYPYLEVKVLEKIPNPQMVSAIQQAAAQRKVCLCRIERVRPQSEDMLSDNVVVTAEDIQKLVPAEIARDAYASVYGEEMPDELARMIAEVKRECETEAE